MQKFFDDINIASADPDPQKKQINLWKLVESKEFV
jgi:hypothetical protein